MLYKTRGIVFRFTKFGETSIIVNIFTEQFGLQSYIVNGVRSKSAKGKIALYQPLTLLNLVVYHKENANIMRIKEVHCAYMYKSLMSDVKKSSQAMFLNEILNKSVKEQSHAQELFLFLFEALIKLDEQETGYENSHLIFLLKLSRFLGFEPQLIEEVLQGRLADIKEEGFLTELLKADFEDRLMMTAVNRRNLLDLLLRFYATHIDNLGEIKSVQVLREILN
ncbi:MAG: DNA repair protein RecO [Bacteroidota bacterium]